MMILCTNKGCLSYSEAKLNVDTNEVICDNCGKTVDNLTSIMRNALKQNGQIVRKSNKKLMLACNKCHANREIVLDQNNKTICSICHTEIQVYAQFKMAIKEAGGLRKVNTEDEKPESDENAEKQEK